MAHHEAEGLEPEGLALCWLAYLLTGNAIRGGSAAPGVVATREENPAFRSFMSSWARHLVIVEALGTIREDLHESQRRTRSYAEPHFVPDSVQRIGDISPPELGRALLRVDAFPRCALLLTVFEGISIDETARLLQADPEAVREGMAIGAADLTRNLNRGARVESQK